MIERERAREREKRGKTERYTASHLIGYKNRKSNSDVNGRGIEGEREREGREKR